MKVLFSIFLCRARSSLCKDCLIAKVIKFSYFVGILVVNDNEILLNHYLERSPRYKTRHVFSFCAYHTAHHIQIDDNNNKSVFREIQQFLFYDELSSESDPSSPNNPPPAADDDFSELSSSSSAAVASPPASAVASPPAAPPPPPRPPPEPTTANFSVPATIASS